MSQKAPRNPGTQPAGRREVEGFPPTQWEPTSKCKTCGIKGGKTRPMRYTPCRNSQICWSCEVNNNAVKDHLRICKGHGCVEYMQKIRDGSLPQYDCPQDLEAWNAHLQQLQDSGTHDAESRASSAQPPKKVPTQSKSSQKGSRVQSDASALKSKGAQHHVGLSSKSKDTCHRATDYQDVNESEDRDTLSDDSTHQSPRSKSATFGRSVTNPDFDLQSGSRMSDSRPPEQAQYIHKANNLFDEINGLIIGMCVESHDHGESGIARNFRRQVMGDTLASLQDVLQHSQANSVPKYWQEQQDRASPRRRKAKKRDAREALGQDGVLSRGHRKLGSKSSSSPESKRPKLSQSYAFLLPPEMSRDDYSSGPTHKYGTGSFRRPDANKSILASRKTTSAIVGSHYPASSSRPALPKTTNRCDSGASHDEYRPGSGSRRAAAPVDTSQLDPSNDGYRSAPRRMTGIQEGQRSSTLAHRAQQYHGLRSKQAELSSSFDVSEDEEDLEDDEDLEEGEIIED